MNSTHAAGVAVIAGVVLLAFAGIENSLQSSPVSSSEGAQSISSDVVTTTNSAPLFSVQDYGPVITLSQATLLINYNFTLPTSFPDNLQLGEIRGGENLIYLIFSSPTISPIQSLGGGSMLVMIARDNTSYASVASTIVAITQYCTTPTNQSVTSICSSSRNTETVSQIVGGRTNVLVNKYPGWGNDPVTATGQHGLLTWWDRDNGLHYAITADLPVSSLLKIGESLMGT